MSTSSPTTKKLSITDMSLAGEGVWPNLSIEKLSAQLNVFYAPPRAGKSSVAQLVGHLMYGKAESTWRRQFGQTLANAEGSLQLDGPQGEFVLRRQFDANRRSRLTISSGRGDAVDGQTIQDLLSGITPDIAARVFHVDFAESPRAESLLSGTFARELSATTSTANSTRRQYTCCTPTTTSIVDRVDRQRIDELVKRRDAIAGEIQQNMSLRRDESEVLERELGEIDSALTSKRARTEQLNSQLHGIELKIAELESRLRYYSLEHFSPRPGGKLDVDTQFQEISELDTEITRCRQTLADLQQRENLLRTELAKFGPDGTADSVTCLADGRATLGTLEQLLDDLDAEVSQLARAHEPGRCIGHDAHAKLTPVASLLRQQVYTLCGQITEQERTVRRKQLTTESRQLARVHVELGERLDLLLSRRESLVQRTQLANRPTRLSPQPPAAAHCRCEHHGEFVQVADAITLGRADLGRHEADLRDELADLQRQRRQLNQELDHLHHDIQQLELRWENLQRERAGLMGIASIEQKQAELERLEAVIRQSLQAGEARPITPAPGVWRASDVLAQLTNGQLVQIRLERHQSQATIIDRNGKSRTLEQLTRSEHDQVYLALTLSLVSAYARRGIYLPLVLDEPFLQQSSAEAAVMAGVLDEFARAGHQLLIFTEDREVRQRFETLSAKCFDLESLRQPRVAPAPTTTIQTTNTRIVRETHDGHRTPALKIAAIEGDAPQSEVFFLTEASTFDDFPVLGAETSSLFSRINIFSVGDLLAADATEIARQLNREGITGETVCLWQIHMGLMCFVPNLTLEDAQVLSANGIDSPDDLFDTDVEALQLSIASFFNTDRGRRFSRARSRYSRSQLSNWRSGAQRNRHRWQRSSNRYSGWRTRRSSNRNGSSRRNTGRHDTGRQTSTRQRTERQPRRTTRTQSSASRKFYLSRAQDVEDAPSIGPKTADRLAKVGIRTVADLLNADPDSTAAELDVSHINAATFAAWQHQARLVCQIPGLRGYAAQLLVACGMTQPEQIAQTGPDKLVSAIIAFCDTKEGQRILRSGDAPDREKIAEWALLAAESRPLEAA